VYDGPRQESLLIDSASGRQTARTPIENLDNDLFKRCCCFSPDGRVAALVKASLKDPIEFSVRLWDVEAESERAMLRDSLYPMQFSPDGRTLVAESYAFDPHQLRLWDVTTGQIRGTLPGFEPAEPYSRLAFSPDGRRLLGPGLDGNGGWWFVVWDVAARQVRAEHGDMPFAAWAADGLLVVVSMNPKWSMHIEVHDPDTGARESGPEFSAVRDAVRFPTGLPHPAALSDDGRFLLARLSHPAPAWVRWLVERLPALRRLVSDAPRSAVHVWESRTGRPMMTLWRDTDYALLAPDGQTLVTVEPDAALRLWDVPPRHPGGIVLALMIAEVGLLTAWTAWRRARTRRRARLTEA
jgi:WD40 repeat protein